LFIETEKSLSTNSTIS